MQIVLQQLFPLGRFHATPWRTNPFDDPYGEWPPSPWRLVRAVTARWYQWAREAPSPPETGELDALVAALCTSRYRFRLPPSARRGRPVRQYFPTEFDWNPRGNKPGVRTYGRSLAQDNYWCVPPTDDGAVWWFLDGDGWTEHLAEVCDHCLERITYFGRAESFTRIHKVPAGSVQPNCELTTERGAGFVPVLVPTPVASRADVERVTDDKASIAASIPPGTKMMYARRPLSPPAREVPRTRPTRPECRLVQLAVGWHVPPEPRAVVRLTSRFRGAVLGELLRIKTGDDRATWRRVAASVREAVADMFGKDAAGNPLAGHRHAEFFAWCEDGVPTRLLVWRDGRPFDQDEQTAIARAASREVSWAAPGAEKADQWKVRLVPLDRSVPEPPGFDGRPAREWVSVTPYVPPRHHLRGGKSRDSESIVAQIRRELGLRGFEGARNAEVQQVGDAAWVAVHVPRRQASERQSLGDRRGYRVRISLDQPVMGPLRLGHSSSFGLGLFQPVLGAEGAAFAKGGQAPP